MVRLLPLEHLDLALQSIGIFGDNAEISVTQVNQIVASARYVDKLSVVVLSWLVFVSGDARFAGNRDHSCKSDRFFLILPQEDLGEGHEEEAQDHGCDAVGIIGLVDGFEAGGDRGRGRGDLL